MTISKCLLSIVLLQSCGLINGNYLWKRTASDKIYSEDRLSHFFVKRAAVLDKDGSTQCRERSQITYTTSTTAQLDIRFPSIHTTSNDEYLCTGHKIPFENKRSYIVKFTPHADMEQTHHMLVYGCPDMEPSTESWKCSNPCRGGVIVFAWARNAPELKLPKDVGFNIGKESDIKYIVVQMHFAKAFKKGSCAGVTAQITTKRQKNLAGIYLLGAFNIFLPPHSTNVPTPISCLDKTSGPMHVFAFRTHSHTHDVARKKLLKILPINHGAVITGYRYRNNTYDMIGKGNPKWPQSFYPRVGGEIVLNPGDIIMAECVYNNPGDTPVSAGSTGSDEMCNLYLMFYTPDKQVLKETRDCWGMNTDVTFPASALDLAPYPGYAGQDSINAILSGKATAPPVPAEHTHHHHGGKDTEVSEEEQNPKNERDGDERDNHPVLSNQEIDRKLEELNPSSASRSRSHGMPAFQGLQADLSYPHLSSKYQIGQVGGLVAAPGGSVYVFHRGNRTWDSQSFDSDNRFTEPDQPIEVDTVYHLSKDTGEVLSAWGRGQFFMPHGASLDHEGYIWLTDVAMHQVFKYNLNNPSKPVLTLGVRMQPGKDEKHFCKPTDVAVDSNGMIFISDGYCNGRVMKFSSDGAFVKQWGEMVTSKDLMAPEVPPLRFFIAHSIILCGPDHSELCVADRENGRIQCFTKDGELTRVIQDKEKTGTRIFAIAYSPLEDGVIFGVNGPGAFTKEKEGGFTINYNSGKVVDRWQPSNEVSLRDPHDITTSPDGTEVFVGDLSHKKVFKFNNIPSENSDTDMVIPIEDARQKKSQSVNGTSMEAKDKELIDMANGVASTIIIVCLVAVPTIALIVSISCIRMRARRLQEYESILSHTKTSRKPLGIGKLRSAPEKAGFKRISMESTDDEMDSDVEVFSKKKTLQSQKSSIYF